MSVFGIYKGTGSALTIGLGFIPNKITITAVGGNTVLVWDKNSNLAGKGGIVTTSSTSGESTTVSHAVLAASAGIIPFYGDGTIEETAQTAKLIPVSETDLEYDQKGGINAWTLTTAANCTGKFNTALNTNCGIGSEVAIRSKAGVVETYRIVNLSNDGDADDDVTLDRAVLDGEVIRIGTAVDYVGAPAGAVIPDGIIIKDTSYVNASGSLYSIEAE